MKLAIRVFGFVLFVIGLTACIFPTLGWIVACPEFTAPQALRRYAVWYVSGVVCLIASQLILLWKD